MKMVSDSLMHYVQYVDESSDFKTVSCIFKLWIGCESKIQKVIIDLIICYLVYFIDTDQHMFIMAILGLVSRLFQLHNQCF